MNTKEYLHERFNPDSLHSPVRVQEDFNRRHLAKLFNELGFKRGAEIGVDAGRNSLILCQEIPDLELWSIDPWLRMKEYSDPITGKQWGAKDESRTKRNYERTVSRLTGHNAHIIKGTSMDVVRDWDIELDFVYIDANHNFNWVMEDLINWSKHVRNGGIVSGHDYSPRFTGLQIAVNAYTEYHVDEWFLNTDKAASYFWAK